jgi:hypothetical protein
MKRSQFLSSRRIFLGGAAACLTLPWLESLAGSGHVSRIHGRRVLNREAAPRRRAPTPRFIVYYVPNGIHMPGWTPSAEGEGYDLPAILAPLRDEQGNLDWRDRVHVLSGLSNEPSRPDGLGDHAAGTAGFLTCRHIKKSETEIANGISVDQVLAKAIGSATPLPSLQLGIEGGDNAGNCDSGYGCAYSRNISWADASSPLPKITAPQVAFNLIFAGADPSQSAEEVERRKRYRRSVLDAVHDDASTLYRKLNGADQKKVDEYFNGIRELERRIDAVTPSSCDTSTFSATFTDFAEHVAVMTELMALTVACDMTRVITFMQGNAASGQSYGFLNIPESHHDLSHHGGDPQMQAKLQTINTWEVENFVRLLARLDAIVEEDSSALEQSVVLFSSEIEDGNSHSHNNLPVLLAGRAGGALPEGRHLRFEGGKMADLYLSILNALGVHETSFGDDGNALLSGLAMR